MVRRSPAIIVVCYLAVGAGLFMLPNATWAHHWVIGTPFQYLAIALAIGPRARRLIHQPAPGLTCRVALLSAVAVLMLVRAQGTLSLTQALAQGASSRDVGSIADPTGRVECEKGRSGPLRRRQLGHCHAGVLSVQRASHGDPRVRPVEGVDHNGKSASPGPFPVPLPGSERPRPGFPGRTVTAAIGHRLRGAPRSAGGPRRRRNWANWPQSSSGGSCIPIACSGNSGETRTSHRALHS